MNAKKIFALLLSVLMVVTCFAGMLTVSADEADKFAPTGEEKIDLFTGEQQATPYGSYGKGQSFGVKVTVDADKRLTQVNFNALATYSNNTNRIAFQVYQWDTDYKTTVSGNMLAQTTIVNHTDNAPLNVILPTNRNLTGELLILATYVDGPTQMTPWPTNGAGIEGVEFFSNGSKGNPFCIGITVGDKLTVTPASYTATFVAEGTEVGKVTFLEGDKELMNIPAVPEKEGYWADWATYTLGNEDITIEAVYTDASGAIKPAIEDATKMDAFAEEHYDYLKAEGCAVRVNRDGSVSFVGNWAVDGDIDAYATINYRELMRRYYTGWDGNNSIPNKSQKFNVIAVKVKAPAVCLDSDPNIEVVVGRDTPVYVDQVSNTIKCDGTEEYWIFDFSSEPDFTSDIINTIKINWAYSVGEESNLGADFQILGFQFFDTLENALTATGGEEATEAPTEAKTEAPETVAPETEAPATQAPETEAPAEDGCASVVGFGAVAVLAAAAAVVALKKKD